MRSSVAVLVLLCLHAAAEEPAGPTPIQKVVKLLEEMRTTVNKEADEDKEAYDTYKCWCETNEKEKTEAISSAEALIEELTSFIEEAAGTEGRLKTEIAALAADIADDTDALETATAMKEKETAEFEADESYMKTTLAALKEAVSVLSEVQLLQKSHKAVDQTSALLQVRAVIEKAAPQFRGVMQRDLMDFLGAAKHLAPSKQAAFLDAKQPIEGGGAAAGAKSYNSRSGEIFGVLGAMEDQFKADLTAAQKEEMMAIIQFQKLKAAKTSEISAASKQKDQKETELTDTVAKAAQAKEDLEATKSTLTADQAFMADLTKNCELADQEYADRVKIRNEELLALAETLQIVTSDEARDLFGKTISLLQVDSANQDRLTAKVRARMKAMKKIVRTAAKHKNWALAGLAVKVQLETSDPMVDHALDTMLARLQKQLKEETEKFDACNVQIDETEDNMKVNRREHDDLDDTHKQLSNTIATLTDEISVLKKDVEDMEIALKQAGETRKTENLNFQQGVSDQRATIKILTMALDRLKEFYGFVQVDKAAAPPRPGGFSKNKQSGGVMQMIAKIISDAEIAESDYVMSEKDGQAEYVSFVADSTASIEADRGAIAEKEALLANDESEISMTKESQLANDDAYWKLKKLLVNEHRECDFILKYFEMREAALHEEIEGVNDAKAALHGAGGASLH
eukprot:gnl/TRDRNA2_/TRDRNA2_176011_c0_seq71.p1 gnl/TRDRNA2_/TRDRNA2_176011_c0~~gnl/TRDRNA2_/TRDRNA2_176011_c0_seq71.p1  ORF type:complete len:686 (+),score=242.82 gnl/TRDRNA2_/TRDRNA2_176011_c0_seq71:68-2125(+)